MKLKPYLPVFICLFLMLLYACSYTDNLKTNWDHWVETPIGDSHYFVSLPANYVIKETKDKYYAVYFFNSKDTSQIAPFYGGFHFSLYSSSLFPNDSNWIKSKITNTFLGRKTEWIIYHFNEEYEIQTIVENEDKETLFKNIHIFGYASSLSNLSQLIHVFSTIKYKE